MLIASAALHERHESFLQHAQLCLLHASYQQVFQIRRQHHAVMT